VSEGRHRRLLFVVLAAGLALAPFRTQSADLTDAQRRGLYLALVRYGTTEQAPPGFTPKVGDAVPGFIRLAELPAPATEPSAPVRCYDYVMFYYFGMTGNVVLLVEPKTRTIVDVIGPTSGAW
jgi:hypothetical protein